MALNTGHAETRGGGAVAASPDGGRASAPLPERRGPISTALCTALPHDPHPDALPAKAALALADAERALATADPFGEDVQLALHICYELHYRGFQRVDPEWEWRPELLRLRGRLERAFTTALRRRLPGGDDVGAELDRLLVEPLDVRGVSHHLRDAGEWGQLREYVAHRSIYHLKEADPHAWVIPRLRGTAKAALVAVEFDEFGGGRAERMHSRLFADLMAETGLDPGYLAYQDHVPAEMFATVNLMSLCGLHRSLRGALVGHFAAAEITTAPAARRMAEALERLGAGPRATRFFTEHIEADAVHEQIMRREVIEDLLRREPELAADVVFGIQATEWLEERLGERLLCCWDAGRGSLLRPLPPSDRPPTAPVPMAES